MKKIPDFKFYAPKEWEKEKLQKWLKLWNIKKLLDKPLEIDETCTVSEKEAREIAALLRSKVRPFDPRPEVGEIRLLSPDLLDVETLPRYIAIIKKWDDENYLTAPFSIFPISAVQGELETGREHFSLANLELWNAVVAPFVTLKKSWIVDKMNDEEIDDAFSVFKFISSGEKIPEHLEDRIGPPILLDNDPRIVYQDEETEVFVPFREVCSYHLESIGDVEQLFEENTIQFPMLLAADDGEPISTVGIFKSIEDFVASIKSNLFPKGTMEALTIDFDLEDNKYDFRWKIEDSDFHIDGTEMIFVIDRKTLKIRTDAYLVKEEAEPYLLIFQGVDGTKIRKDISPEDIYIAIVRS